MRTLLWLMAASAAALLAAGAVGAVPGHFGPTGIVATPTADVVGAKTYDVAVDYIKWDEFGEDVTSWPLRLVAGVSDQAEVGVGYTSWSDSAPTMKIIPINAKLMIRPESASAPAVAIGAAYGTFKDAQLLNPAFSDDVKVTTVYAVATKMLSGASGEGGQSAGGQTTLRGSLGVMYNKYSDSTSGSATKPFASLEFALPDGKTTVEVEYKVKEKIAGLKESGLSSLVLRHMFRPDFWAQIGLTNAWYTVANPDCGQHELFIGVGYRWVSEPEQEWY